VLIAIGDANGAVAVLQPALRGPLEASNLFVTRTDLYEMLGRALDAAGQRDSAAVIYRRVASDWQGADDVIHRRREGNARRLRATQR
jgi:hypothetical protein